MSNKLLDSLKQHMERLDFVQWDRFTVDQWSDGVDACTVYGWIERDDGKADYVQLTTWDDTEDIWFTTSSAEYSKEISQRLYGEELSEEHNECKRVENHLDIENVIEVTDDE